MPVNLRTPPLLLALALALAVLVPDPAVHPVVRSEGAASQQTARASVTVERLPVERVSVERAAPEPRPRPAVVAVSTPVPTEAPLEAPAAAPIVAATPRQVAVVAARAVPAVATTPAPCPATFFCYPRLGIAGAIVAYDDCSGVTDVGTAIRQLTCVRQGIWLAGHAYTQFGRITGFRVGDVATAWGQRYEITGSSVQRSCAPTTQAVAPLSLQTSLESTTCGRVLVVQARPIG